jgi:hypothetical protein
MRSCDELIGVALEVRSHNEFMGVGLKMRSRDEVMGICLGVRSRNEFMGVGLKMRSRFVLRGWLGKAIAQTKL